MPMEVFILDNGKKGIGKVMVNLPLLIMTSMKDNG